MGSLTADLISLASEFSLSVKIAWAVWLAWGIAQLVWMLWPRREAPLYRTTQSNYSSSAVRTASRSSVWTASRANITPAPVEEVPMEVNSEFLEPEAMRLVAALASSEPEETVATATASGKHAVVKSLVGGTPEFLAALGFEEAKQPEKPSSPNQSVYR